jgi:hypothetical protein
MTRVVFSIDDGDKLHSMAKFLHNIDKLRAMKKLKGDFKLCIDTYKGVPEYSFICSVEDYKAFVVEYGWTNNQESVILIFSDNECVIVDKKGRSSNLGIWTNVSKFEIKGDYTYIMEDKTWWQINSTVT